MQSITPDKYYRLTFQSMVDTTTRTDVSRGVDEYEAADLHGGFRNFELIGFEEIDVVTYDSES